MACFGYFTAPGRCCPWTSRPSWWFAMTCPCQFLFDRRPRDPDLAGTQQAPADQRWNQPSNGGESLHSLNDVIIWWILKWSWWFYHVLSRICSNSNSHSRGRISDDNTFQYLNPLHLSLERSGQSSELARSSCHAGEEHCRLGLHMFAQFVHSAFDLTFVQLYIVVQKCLTKTWARQIWKVSASDQRCGTFLAFRIMIGTENNNEQYKYSKQH